MASPKTPPPDRRLDAAAFALLALGLALAACVLSFHPGRTPDLADPPQYTSDNLLGAPGAMLAENLFDVLGTAVYVLLGGWFVVAVTLFRRSSPWRWLLRLAGWLMLLPCSAVAAHQIGLWANDAALFAGTGGFLGAGLTQWLVANFSS